MTPPDSSRHSTLLDRPAASAATRPASRLPALPERSAEVSPRVAGQVLVAVSWLVGAALVVLAARLLRGPSETLYLAITARTAELPGSGLVAEGGVLALLGLCAVVAWRSRRAGPSAVATTLVAGVGAVVAYAASEAVKSLVRQPRGCWELVEVAHCPAAGDWSFPSNHTAIAFALAAAVVLAGAPAVRVPGAVPARHAHRLPLRDVALWVVLPAALAVAVATARVAEGVHFPHDVVAGAAVGVAVVVAALTVLTGPATAVVVAACRVDGVRRVLLARPS
ncbi:phosphatase PAP2 family protein [Cellulosimicrobium cellulans]|uniref:phosphatase PAP2 family protein n=1 Tax=Cellulosimicrobium cellulans TaxID=1710 RepID=UPI0019647D44|nr:phosphatase PAP2 family protein [Cellulosimicrobium cellulans]MBN0040886.1 phosphatase PAP2 family protein [Cellulosimicrobium cellulans]